MSPDEGVEKVTEDVRLTSHLFSLSPSAANSVSRSRTLRSSRLLLPSTTGSIRQWWRSRRRTCRRSWRHCSCTRRNGWVDDLDDPIYNERNSVGWFSEKQTSERYGLDRRCETGEGQRSRLSNFKTRSRRQWPAPKAK